MPAFTDPETARHQTPQEWFSTITNGRIENLMPPWGDSLSEEDRWAVALYTYTMAYSPELLRQGETLWQDNCVECHGETGRGDGPKASEINRPIGNLTEQTEIVTYSDQNLYTIVTEGQGQNMPSFADDLTDAERYAVVAYARTLSLGHSDVIGQIPPTPDAAAAAEATAEVTAAVHGTITGMVTNGTSASTVPSDLQVNLIISSGGNLVSRQQTNLSDTSFTFTDVPIIAGADYVTAVIYRDRLFTSSFVSGDELVTTMDMPITIYELTEDPAVLSISGVVTQVSAIGDTLEVRQVFRFNNSGDRVFTTSNSLGDNVFASVIVSLPPGAQVVSFDDPNRYVVSDQNFSIVDTAPVFPGDDHLVVVVYILPYDGSPALIEQPVNYPMNGQVQLLVYPESLSVTSEQLPSLGPRTLGNNTYQAYGTTLSLASGDVIRYELSGAAAPAAEDVSVTTSSGDSNALPILLGIIGVAAILAGVLLYLRGRKPAPANNAKLIDALMRQIAELDDAHAAGQLNHDLWHRQRDQLKAHLAELMGDNPKSDDR